MESTIAHQTAIAMLCEGKASEVMRWISRTEDISKSTFSVARLFEVGVLNEDTKAFLHLLLEESFPGDRIDLELSPEEVHSIVNEAIRNTYSYLVTPESFIADFLCNGGSTLRINEAMLSRLSYFVDYEYFPEMIDEWLAIQLREGCTEIPRSDLQKFLLRADRAIMTYAPTERIVKYLDPIFEFHHKTDLLDRTIVDSFLRDKGLTMPDSTALEQFNRDEFVFAIKESLLASTIPEQKNEFPPIPQYDAFLKELRDVGVVLPPPHKEKGELQDHSITLPPIEMFISAKQRKKILEKVFRSNINEYERTMRMIDEIPDYSQSELNLRSVLELHKISQDSKVAIRMNEAIRARFGITSTSSIQ
ncbi:MAG: hypothetical protein Q8916_06830 [Bacteroidota bacterium]|nr:hypothetical protein [Bacteroidota bacterium]MDP4230105.1 hypothetical protein [Bacteroidota bacterium]